MRTIDLETQEVVEIVAEGLGHADGIVPDGKGSWLVSSWAGQAFVVTDAGHVQELLDTREAEQNCADIEYIIEKNLLLVPTFFDNKIIAYYLE